MFSELMRHSNALGFPQGAFFFFFTSFLLLCVVLVRSGKAHWDADAALPLDDEDSPLPRSTDGKKEVA